MGKNHKKKKKAKENKINFNNSSTFRIFECPHCQGSILVKMNELNCKIFRHGTYKDTGKQINPHLEKSKCDKLVAEDKINGCGKPFKFNGTVVEICDYI